MLYSVGAVGARGFAAAEAVVYGLAAFEAGFEGVPVVDGGLAHAPAEEDDLVVEAEGEVEEAGVEVLDLDSDGIDFGDGLFDAREVGVHFGALADDGGYVDLHAAGEVDAAAQLAKFLLHSLRVLLAREGALEQGLKDGEQRLGFV